MTDTVSVIVPVLNGARYLGEALESIATQTRPPDEVIVVDAGSTDGSAAVAAAHGARVECRPDIGTGPARNLGVELSTGTLVAFQDADDLWAPEKLERQIAALHERPEVDLVFGHVRQFQTPELGGRIGDPQPGPVCQTMLARREVLERLGPFSTELRVELMEWLMRARDEDVVELMLDDVLVLRRVHATNTTRNPSTRREYALAIKSALDRRRAEG